MYGLDVPGAATRIVDVQRVRPGVRVRPVDDHRRPRCLHHVPLRADGGAVLEAVADLEAPRTVGRRARSFRPSRPCQPRTRSRFPTARRRRTSGGCCPSTSSRSACTHPARSTRRCTRPRSTCRRRSSPARSTLRPYTSRRRCPRASRPPGAARAGLDGVLPTSAGESTVTSLSLPSIPLLLPLPLKPQLEPVATSPASETSSGEPPSAIRSAADPRCPRGRAVSAAGTDETHRDPEASPPQHRSIVATRLWARTSTSSVVWTRIGRVHCQAHQRAGPT